MIDILEDRINYTKENYNTLPKSTCNGIEFVLIAEDNRGAWDSYKECLGVNSSGKLLWVYSSGDSWQGDSKYLSINDLSTKVFVINKESDVREFYNQYKCDSVSSDYNDY